MSAIGALERIESGQPKLDEILGGGFPAQSLNVIMGAPGTGKTVLAQQLLFHNAKSGRPVVFASTLSEPLPKVVSYLQRFDFYDEGLLFDGPVVYEDLAPALLEHGADVLISRVRELIKEVGPSILVIDSFKAVHDLLESPLRARRLSAELAGLLAAYDTTTFLVGEYTPEDVAAYPEFAVADGVLQLTREDNGKRDDRFLRVLKLRGSGYQEGLHAFTITSGGLKVYPRLVTPSMPTTYTTLVERVPVGVPGFDAIIGGGVWRGSSTLLIGSAGAGKTTFGLSFALEGVQRGEGALFMNFQENPTQLARTINGMDVDLEDLRSRGLHLRYTSPVELQIDGAVLELFRLVDEERIQRVVIDSLSDLVLAADSDARFHDYLYAIVQHLASRRVTSLLTLEAAQGGRDRRLPDTRYNSVVDAMVELSVDLESQPPRRRVHVLKARGIAHSIAPQPLVIRDGRIRVEEPGHG